MTIQFFFSISYVPFVILIAMSCFYKDKKAKILKTLSLFCAIIAIISYTLFIKNIL